MVKVHVEDPLPFVKGDPEALRQAISNLLENAIQYSGEGREIEVRVSASRGGVNVAVRDRGVGIPEVDLPKIFDRFFRGRDDLTRSVRGSGLGLTLVKEIVEKHGGTVGVVSEVRKGSVFSFDIPESTESPHGEDPDR